MKLNNIKTTVLGVSMLAAAAVGCKKSDFAINDNPNDLTESTIDYKTILPAAQANTAAFVASDWKWLQGWMGYWSRSGSFQAISDEESYNFQTDFSVFVWNDLYRNITNYNVIKQKGHAANSGIYEGIARIMMAHDYAMLVDVYGNVPYSEALQGNGNLTPKYDKGIDIYKDLFKQIDTAFLLFSDKYTPGGTGANATLFNADLAKFDLAYAGDTTKWKKLGNTIKLRMLIHAYAVPGFPITDEMAKINASGVGYISANEEFQINPGYTSAKPNPYYRTYVTSESGTATTNFSLVKANSYATGLDGSGTDGYYGINGDPRLSRFYVQNENGYQGIPYGTPSGDPLQAGNFLAGVNGPGLIPTGATSRAWILTSMESLFLQAEARNRGIITTGTSAKDLYEAGVKRSFVWLGLTEADAITYLTTNGTSPDVVYGGDGDDGLYAILSQKWFGLNAIAPYEVWADYRRTSIVYGQKVGYDPGPPLSVNPARSSNVIPVRLLYPQNEYNFNAANVAGEGTVNQFTSKIFWDIN